MIGAMLGIQAATGLVQGIGGFMQNRKGKKMLESLERPTMEVQSEYKQNVNQAERIAQEGIGAATRNQFIQNQNQNSAMQLAGLKSLGAGLKGMSQLSAYQQQGNMSLLSADEQARKQGIMAAKEKRNVLAGKKEDAWNYNENLPYVQDYNQAQAMMGAGQQNMMGALDTIGGSAMNAAYMKAKGYIGK